MNVAGCLIVVASVSLGPQRHAPQKPPKLLDRQLRGESSPRPNCHCAPEKTIGHRFRVRSSLHEWDARDSSTRTAGASACGFESR